MYHPWISLGGCLFDVSTVTTYILTVIGFLALVKFVYVWFLLLILALCFFLASFLLVQLCGVTEADKAALVLLINNAAARKRSVTRVVIIHR